jgi:general secretion pathway protein G
MRYKNKPDWRQEEGFSLIELVFVIAIIGFLSSVIIVSISSARERAQYTKAKTDISQIAKLMTVAKGESQRTAIAINGTNNSGLACESIGSIKSLAPSHSCWTAYIAAIGNLNAVTDNIYRINSAPTDPWGSPYLIDENEGQGGLCYTDHVASAGPDGVPYTSDDVIYNVVDTNCRPNIGGRFANNRWN